MAIAYLLLGSNQGNRLAYLASALQHLQKTVGLLTQKSAVYETAAWGHEDQAAFLNQVVELTTSITPADLLTQINKIEKALGRVREVKWGARVIDIDILYYNSLRLQTQNLVIPHPELQNRRFTLVPLVEIAPTFVHPGLQQTNAELLANCPDTLEVRLFPG
jgi:2-amino-4-hydroxy-6-hydroxymethyldihydropteridine diphosphokinase